MKNKVYESISILENISTRFRPKSQEIYEELVKFTEIFLSFNESEKNELKVNFSANLQNKFLSFSGFLAEFAIFKKSDRYLRAALIFHCIEDVSKDYRENIRYLILINHASTLIRSSIKVLMDNVLANCSPKAAELFKDFLGRDSSLNELEKFGIKFDYDGDFPIYKSK
ncbi:hypothetical protein P3G55_20585 [Leptospira sp. 96542]|nr:hypothetical protein [Leptospira sp. 96542]